MTRYTKEQVVAELAKQFPDADAGPAGLWGFVNAGWDGEVGEQGLSDWIAAWRDAERENELAVLASEHEDDCYEDEGEAAYGRED